MLVPEWATRSDRRPEIQRGLRPGCPYILGSHDLNGAGEERRGGLPAGEESALAACVTVLRVILHFESIV